MGKLLPPTGYSSWLQFAIDTMDARGAFAEKMFEGDMPSQDEIRAAAQEELDQLRAYATDDGPLTEKQVAAFREDAAKHLQIGKTLSREDFF